MARLMLIRGSEPLADARVEVVGKERAFTADGDGQFEVDLESGSEVGVLELVVRHAYGTFRVTVEPEAGSTLTVVDVADHQEESEEGEEQGALQSEEGGFDSHGESLRERYEMKGRLGSGGMGVVVKAEDTVLERTVAIKMLSEELAEYDEAREVFMREVRSLATLSHSNLVSVYDVVEDAERPWMITEFVDGRTLEEAIQSQRMLSQAQVLDIGVQLSRAVEYLHSEEMVHRDIKPGNIMLEEDGALKIIDFGLARSIDDVSEGASQVRGTPAYMAPEQIEEGELTDAIDIYQIGVTLHEVASGQLPFRQGDVGYKHVHEEPPYLGALVPNILPGLADLIHICLSKDPADRPVSASLLREEFERLHALVTSSRVDRERITRVDAKEAEQRPENGSRPSAVTARGRVAGSLGGSDSSPDVPDAPLHNEHLHDEPSSPRTIGSDSEGSSEKDVSPRRDLQTRMLVEEEHSSVAPLVIIAILVAGAGVFVVWTQFDFEGGSSSATVGAERATKSEEAGESERRRDLRSAVERASEQVRLAVAVSSTAFEAKGKERKGAGSATAESSGVGAEGRRGEERGSSLSATRGTDSPSGSSSEADERRPSAESDLLGFGESSEDEAESAPSDGSAGSSASGSTASVGGPNSTSGDGASAASSESEGDESIVRPLDFESLGDSDDESE